MYNRKPSLFIQKKTGSALLSYSNIKAFPGCFFGVLKSKGNWGAVKIACLLAVLLFVECTNAAFAQNTLDNLGLTAATPAGAAYSLRKLSSAYAGSAIRVRRSSDNTQQDIGFTAGGDLDTVSLNSFIGINNGYVAIWYDQSGFARNAVQATLALQPRIVNAGVIDRQSSKPAIFFNNNSGGTRNYLDITIAYTSSDVTMNSVLKRSIQDAATNYPRWWSLANVANDYNNNNSIILNNQNTTFSLYRNSAQIATGITPTLNTTYILTGTRAGTNGSIYVNGSAGTPLTTSAVNLNVTRGRIGNDFATVDCGVNGYISENTLFLSALSAIDRLAVECSQSIYYAVNTYASGFDFYIQGTAATAACTVAQEDVVWKNADLANNVINGNSLIKSQSTGNWNGGAASWNTVSNYGFFQFTASETNTARMAGLSNANANTNYNTIEYAIYLRNDGQVGIYESGTNRGLFGAYSVNDVFKVGVEANIVKYYRNGVVFYISTVAPVLPLLVDVSINTVNGTVTNALVSNLNTGNFSAIVNGVTPVSYQWRINGSPVGSNSATYSNASLSAADIITCDLTYTGTCGTLVTSSARITNIPYTVPNSIAFYISGNAAASACKEAIEDVIWVIGSSSVRNIISSNNLTKLSSNGNWDGNGFSYQSVANNGYMETTVAETSEARMIGLSATDANSSYTSIQYAFFLQNTGTLRIYESGTDRGAFGTYATTDVLKITVENNIVKYYKNGIVLYISTIVPTLPLFVDVSTSNTGATVSSVKVSNGNIGTFTAVGTNLGVAPVYQWKLNGVNVGTNSATYTNTSLANNDVISCTVNPDLGGCSTNPYTSNNITVKNINQTTQNEFYISGTPAASACKEAIADVVWVISSSSVRNTISTNNLTKLTSNGNWDGNGFSIQSVANNGYMQTTAAETNTSRMIGLSSTDANSSYTSIQYAFYLQNTGNLRIYESGTDRGAFGTYTTTDVLKITVENNIVKYYKNGVALYISSIVPTLPLFVDVSTNTTGATAASVKVSNGNISTFTAVGTNLGAAPVYQWKLNGVNAGTNSATYTNTALANNDVVSCTVTPDLGGCNTSAYTSNNITVKDISQTAQNEFYISGAAAASACKEAIADVVWVISSSSVRNTITTNNLSKLTGGGNWDGNGFSMQSVGNNGYMQTTAAETNTARVIGLSATDAGSNDNSIQYAFYLQNSGNLSIQESGTSRGGFGTYSTGDVLKIAVENNIVKYYRNGVAIYISTIAPTLPLFVDVSTYNTGATVSSVKVSNGNISTFTAVGTNLGIAPVYQWKLNGANVGTNSTTYTNTALANTDVLSCTVTPDLGGCSSSVYASNNITINDINQTLQNEFYIAGTAAASACKEAIEDVVWKISSSSVRNTISANNLTKLTSNGNWDGNGFSIQSVANNGYMQTTVAETNTFRMIGLSATDVNNSYTSIQYCFYLQNTGNLSIYESGTSRGGFGTYATTDVLKIAVENNVVKYYKNGVAIYISTIAPTLPLFVDVSTYNTGATAASVQVSNGNISTYTAAGTNLGAAPVYQWKLNGVNVGTNSVTYTNTALTNNDVLSCNVTPDLGGCSSSVYASNSITVKDINQTIQNEFYISGVPSASACKEAVADVVWVISSSSVRNTISANNLTKLVNNGNWDGNGFSTQSVGNNGYMQTTAAETNTARVIGLSATDAGSNDNSIQYAFYLQNSGNLSIQESGTSRGGFGTYSTGDVLKIAIENNIVKYYKNGVAIYISTIAPTLPLFVDVSTYNTGATVASVKVSNGNISTFTAVGTNLGTAPVYQWKLNGINVGTNSTTYTNTALANTDVLSCSVTPDLGGCSSSVYASNNITINDINQTIQNEFYISGAAAASACKEAIADVVWVISSSSLRNTISANNLTKLTSNGNWDGNGFSTQSVANNGYMQTTTIETNTSRMIGLSAADANSSYTSIQYAFYLQSSGNLAIYESGTNRGGFGTYASTDILKIAVENNVVKYYKNGVLLYASGVVPTLPLFVDVSTNAVGATVAAVKISNGNISTFTANATNAGTAPVYQWKLNGVNVGTNSTTYSNGSLVNGDIITCILTPDLGGCSTNTYSANNIAIQTPGIATTNWLGVTNAWNTPGNWSNGVPTKYTSVTISGGAVNPVISTNAIAKDISISASRSLTINAANSLEIFGNWSNLGTFTPNTSTVKFSGCAATTISSSAAETFYNVIINNDNGITVSSGTHNVANNINFITGIVTNSATINVQDNATVTGMSNISYIDGTCRKTGNDAFTFPVGKGGFYRPCSISAPLLVTDHFTAQYFNYANGAYNNTLKDPFIDHISTCEYWTVDRTGGASNVNVTLTWDINSCGVTNLTDLIVTRWNGSMWKDHGNGGTTGNTTAGSVITIAPVTSFSPFTLASHTFSNPLPVELISFHGQCKKDSIEFKWVTTTELNNHHFILEQSKDASSWITIGTIAGAGNSSAPLHYSFTHAKTNDAIFYRLKQTDFDGNFKYSKVIKVENCDKVQQQLSIYPNPVRGIVNLIYDGDKNAVRSIEIYNIMGEKVYTTTGYKSAIDLTGKPAGFYFVHLNLQSKVITKKVVIEK
jgi:hypothetical protein